MMTRSLITALALSAGLALPAAAEAGHRHSRSCGHYDGRGYGYRNDYRYDGRYDGRYARRYGNPYGYGHRSRGYGYGGYYYAPPPPRYYYARPYGYYGHGHRYHGRPRISIHIGF